MMSILQIKQIVKSVRVAVYNQHCLHLPPLIQAQYFFRIKCTTCHSAVIK